MTTGPVTLAKSLLIGGDTKPHCHLGRDSTLVIAAKRWNVTMFAKFHNLPLSATDDQI
jgi:hypothetical protein